MKQTMAYALIVLGLLFMLVGSYEFGERHVSRLVSRELRSQLVSIIHLTVAEQEQGTLVQLRQLQRQVAQLHRPSPRRWWQCRTRR